MPDLWSKKVPCVTLGFVINNLNFNNLMLLTEPFAWFVVDHVLHYFMQKNVSYVYKSTSKNWFHQFKGKKWNHFLIKLKRFHNKIHGTFKILLLQRVFYIERNISKTFCLVGLEIRRFPFLVSEKKIHSFRNSKNTHILQLMLKSRT